MKWVLLPREPNNTWQPSKVFSLVELFGAHCLGGLVLNNLSATVIHFSNSSTYCSGEMNSKCIIGVTGDDP